VLTTGVDLGSFRFVLWGNAADGVGDCRIEKLKAVVRTRFEDTLGEAEFHQRGIEQVAGIVPGERPACPVRSAQTRRKADDQHTNVLLAATRQEAWHRAIEPFGLARSPSRDEARETGAE